MTAEEVSHKLKPVGLDAYFVEKVLPLQREMYRLAYAYVRNREDAEDIASEAIYRAYVNLFHFTPEQLAALKAHAWLCKITRHLCWDHLQKKRQVNVASLEVVLNGEDDQLPTFPADDPEILALVCEFIELVQNSLPDSLTLLYLFYVKGISVKRLANWQGVNEAAIHARMFLARKRLHKTLHFKENEELLTRVVRAFYHHL